MEMGITTISSKGQVVIPQEVRKRLALRDGESLAVSMQDSLIVLKKVDNKLEEDDLRTLEEIKSAWKEIEEGKCVRCSSEEFLKDIKKW